MDVAEIDHIIPFSKGGKTTLDNAQLTHMHCNRSNENHLIYKLKKLSFNNRVRFFFAFFIYNLN